MVPADPPVRVALDENFPETFIECIQPMVKKLAFFPLKMLDPRLLGTDDWRLLLAMPKHGIRIVVTCNDRMLKDPKALLAVEKTKLCLVAVDSLGDNAMRSTGVVLHDLPWIAANLTAGAGEVFHVQRGNPKRQKPKDFLAILSLQERIAVGELRKRASITDAELQDPLGGGVGPLFPSGV